MRKLITNFISSCKDILYPKTCLICKRSLAQSPADELVCQGCWATIKRNKPPFCTRCGRSLDKRSWAKNICSTCLKRPLAFDRAFSPCVYEGTIKELLHALKYANKDYLSRTLSGLMIAFIKEYKLPIDYIDLCIPIPLHPARLREREFNQAALLCGYVARAFDKQLATGALVRTRDTRTQTDLASDARIENVRNSFAVKDAAAVKEKNILLVDDVLTTGATSSEAAAALKRSGANMVLVLTLAN